MKDAMSHAESHASFDNGVCVECAELGKQQGTQQERERIYAWLTVILPADVLLAVGSLLREALYGHADYPTEPR